MRRSALTFVTFRLRPTELRNNGWALGRWAFLLIGRRPKAAEVVCCVESGRAGQGGGARGGRLPSGVFIKPPPGVQSSDGGYGDWMEESESSSDDTSVMPNPDFILAAKPT